VFPQQATFFQPRRQASFAPRLYTIAVRPGPNRVLEQMEGAGDVTVIPRRGSLKQDLIRLFSSWQHGATRLGTSRDRVEHQKSPNPEGGIETSLALIRLWTWDEVQQILRTEDEQERERAVALATNYRIVTPVSAAVVLETTEQYQAAGLTPGPKGSLSTVPEPETFILVITGVGLMGWLRWFRRRNV